MPARPVPEDHLRKAVAYTEDALREGHPPEGRGGNGGGVKGAARIAGERLAAERLILAYDQIYNWLHKAKDRLGLEPDWSAYRPRIYHRPSPGAPQIASHHMAEELSPTGDPITVCVIGDAHDAPHLPDKSRFRWIGEFVAKHRFDWVVSIGDWMSLDSLSTHTERGTWEGLSKPTFPQDIESFHASQRAFQQGLGSHRPKKDVVLGNHEHRAARWDNQHPEAESHMQKIHEAFMQWGWRTTPYGEFRFIGGVGFIHAPLVPGTNGKTYGGKTGNQRASNDAMFDIVRGDDHKHGVAGSPKIGPVRSPKIYDAATALPPGFIEQYAAKNAGDWEAGIASCTIWGGRVMRWSFTDMHLLKREHDRPAAV